MLIRRLLQLVQRYHQALTKMLLRRQRQMVQRYNQVLFHPKIKMILQRQQQMVQRYNQVLIHSKNKRRQNKWWENQLCWRSKIWI